MKQFGFLFDNIVLFHFTYLFVIFRTVLSIYQAALVKSFEWKRLTDCIRNMIDYSAWLIFGNMVDYIGETQGVSPVIGTLGVGCIFAFGLISFREVGDIKKKLQELRPIYPEQEPEQVSKQ